jgi:hypothetical protein
LDLLASIVTAFARIRSEMTRVSPAKEGRRRKEPAGFPDSGGRLHKNLFSGFYKHGYFMLYIL